VGGWGAHTFWVCNPGKDTKYRIIVCKLCESVSAYSCIKKISDAKCGPLTDIVGFLLQAFEGKGFHFYQDNYYNIV
jgi:hypothetical protein